MFPVHQTEHPGPKTQVSELVHPEHGINSGAVDSVARRMASRISKHTQLKPSDVFLELVALRGSQLQAWNLGQQQHEATTEEILYLPSIQTAAVGTSGATFATQGFTTIRRH